jgi:hypothetical protein
MGVYEGRGNLSKAMKTLLTRWADARMEWNDSRAVEFEQKFLQPLEVDLRSAVGAMDHMAVLLAKIRQECQ